MDWSIDTVAMQLTFEKDLHWLSLLTLHLNIHISIQFSI